MCIPTAADEAVVLQMFHVNPLWACRLVSAAVAGTVVFRLCRTYAPLHSPLATSCCTTIALCWGWRQAWFGRKRKLVPLEDEVCAMDEGGEDDDDEADPNTDEGREKRRRPRDAVSSLCALCGDVGADVGVREVSTLQNWCKLWTELWTDAELQTSPNLTGADRVSVSRAAQFLKTLGAPSGEDDPVASGNVENGSSTPVRVHKRCRESVSNRSNLEAARARSQMQQDDGAGPGEANNDKPCKGWHDAVPSRRSQERSVDSGRPCCIICRLDARYCGGYLHQVQTVEVQEALLKRARDISQGGPPPHGSPSCSAYEAALRITMVLNVDLIAAEVHTHRRCRLGFCDAADTDIQDDAAGDARTGALDCVCNWLREELGERPAVKLAECHAPFLRCGGTGASGNFPRLREELVQRYNAGLPEDSPERLEVHLGPGGTHEGYYLSTARTVAGCVSNMHKLGAKMNRMEDEHEINDMFVLPELTDDEVLARASRLLRRVIERAPRRTGGVPTPAGLGREEAIHSAGGLDLSNFLHCLIAPGVDRVPWSAADNRANSIAADLVLAAVGQYQPKHLAVSFLLRDKTGCAAADMMADLGHSAPSRIGAEVCCARNTVYLDCNLCCVRYFFFVLRQKYQTIQSTTFTLLSSPHRWPTRSTNLTGARTTSCLGASRTS